MLMATIWNYPTGWGVGKSQSRIIWSRLADVFRFVNCAPSLDELNLLPLFYHDDVYYTAPKEIPAGKELFTDYGKAYANSLGSSLHENTKEKRPCPFHFGENKWKLSSHYSYYDIQPVVMSFATRCGRVAVIGERGWNNREAFTLQSIASINVLWPLKYHSFDKKSESEKESPLSLYHLTHLPFSTTKVFLLIGNSAQLQFVLSAKQHLAAWEMLSWILLVLFTSKLVFPNILRFLPFLGLPSKHHLPLQPHI